MTRERTAYDVLETASEEELVSIFFNHGEQRAARRLARAIVERRERGKLPTTLTEFYDLATSIMRGKII